MLIFFFDHDQLLEDIEVMDIAEVFKGWPFSYESDTKWVYQSPPISVNSSSNPLLHLRLLLVAVNYKSYHKSSNYSKASLSYGKISICV